MPILFLNLYSNQHWARPKRALLARLGYCTTKLNEKLGLEVPGLPLELLNGLGPNKSSSFGGKFPKYRPASPRFHFRRAQSESMALSQNSHLKLGPTVEQQMGLGLGNKQTTQTSSTSGPSLLGDKNNLGLGPTGSGFDFGRPNSS